MVAMSNRFCLGLLRLRAAGLELSRRRLILARWNLAGGQNLPSASAGGRFHFLETSTRRRLQQHVGGYSSIDPDRRSGYGNECGCEWRDYYSIMIVMVIVIGAVCDYPFSRSVFQRCFVLNLFCFVFALFLFLFLFFCNQLHPAVDRAR